jgi:hypothetical protein
VILTELAVDPADLAARTGWDAKPQGLCKGDACVPAPDALRPDGRLDVEVVATRLGMPIVHDQAHGLWALGPESGGRALTTAALPDIALPDRSGEAFHFSSLVGRKAIIVAWASW